MKKIGITLLLILFASIAAFAQAPPTLEIRTETPGLPSELYYGNIKVKPVRLRPGTNQVITIDDADFFVNQSYVDFLNRFPDAGGFNYWIYQISGCGADQACIFKQRIDVSNAFFFRQANQ